MLLIHLHIAAEQKFIAILFGKIEIKAIKKRFSKIIFIIMDCQGKCFEVGHDERNRGDKFDK